MLRKRNAQAGFSLAELLIVIAIIGVLATVVVMNMKGSETGAKEAKLKANLKIFREALIAYNADHGFFPCTQNDYNNSGNETTFKRQLTWYTDASGRPSKTKSDRYRFGPYVQKFPENPFYTGTDKSRMTKVVIDRTHERILSELQKAVAAGSGNYGWYYEAKSGNVVPNLGGSAFSDKYCYF
ncbi:MAG TPA: type II secretion system protein [Bacteroidetes bacterium]|nr:type II secretion system protein [Bacteroidota bacterium]